MNPDHSLDQQPTVWSGPGGSVHLCCETLWILEIIWPMTGGENRSVEKGANKTCGKARGRSKAQNLIWKKCIEIQRYTVEQQILKLWLLSFWLLPFWMSWGKDQSHACLQTKVQYKENTEAVCLRDSISIISLMVWLHWVTVMHNMQYSNYVEINQD